MKNKLLVLLAFCLIGISVFFVIRNNQEILLGDTSYLSGDVDGNGKIGSSDYVLVRKYILKQTTFSSNQLKRADTNNDGKVSSADFVAIRKKIINGTTNNSNSIDDSNNNMKESSSTNSDVLVYESKYNYVVADFNVKDYGADSTGQKDSSDAFQKALNAANECAKSNTCGGTVFVPKGTYLLEKTVSVHTYTALIGELEEGTTNGTLLMIKHDSGTTDYNKSALIVQVFGSVQNMAFWYPDQKIENGSAKAYPPTISFGNAGTDGVTLENLYFVNPYIAMDFKSSRENESIQFIRRIYGTPLNIGLINESNYDTIKMETVNFSSKYWLESKMSKNIPSKSSLDSYLKNSSTKPTGIHMGDVDWFFFANINIDGYYRGINSYYTKGQLGSGAPEGELFDSRITNCYYPIYMEQSSHVVITNSKITANGGSGARAINISQNCTFDCSILGSEISSTGDYAIYHNSTRSITISNSKIGGRIGKGQLSSQISLISDSLTNTGYEGCSNGNYSSLDFSGDYKKRVANKPKSKNIIKIDATIKTDITSKINDAISKLKSTGGIVYIPRGNYIVSSNITVPSGIEIRGAISWAHHEGYVGSTILETTYKGDSLFTLQSNSGLNGFAVRQTDNIGDTSIKSYPYVIKGNGSNIYIMNIVLPTIYNGINLSGCDNHYVEHIWGEFYNIGINVDGGSKNGIIRDSHFQLTVLRNNNHEAVKKVMTNQTVIRLGSSSNETVLHTFTFGPNIGYDIDGAKNFYIIGVGADYSHTGVRISGAATGRIVNSMIVADPFGTWNNKSLGVEPKNNHYYVSTSNYSGMVKVFNSMNWGNDKSTAFVLAGTGDLHFTSGIIENTISPAIITSNAAQSISGMIISQANNSPKFQFNKGANAVSLVGNVCTDGNACTSKMTNNAGITIGYLDPIVNCSGKVSNPTPASVVTSSDWERTIVVDTSVSTTSATTKLCGFGTTSGTLEYKGSCTSEKTATISNDCATINLTACKNSSFSYRVKGSSEWKVVNEIGKYLIIGQTYNQLLFVGGSASNNSSNIGNWVSNCPKLSVCIKNIGNEAIKNRAGDSNENFVKYAYKGILGRTADTVGLNNWVDALNNGEQRASVINGFVDSQEASAIYSAWGYN